MGIRELVYQSIKDRIGSNYCILDSSLLKSDLGLCSFDMMTILILIEQKTNKDINIDLLGRNPTVLDLINAIKKS